MMKFVENRYKFFMISSAVAIACLIILIVNIATGKGAFELDVEFSGGTSVLIDIRQDFSNDDILTIVKETTSQTTPQIQPVIGKNQVQIKTKPLTSDEKTAMIEAIFEKYSLTSDDILDSSDVSPTVSSEMQRTAIIALLVASIAMLLYVAVRFHNFAIGISTILALMHDILLTFLFYSVLRIPLNLSFIAVLLTILGYSINATIIVFDRVRENKKLKRMELPELINLSVNQTLKRSLYTTLTTLFSVVALYIFGLEEMKQFALPIIIGLGLGAYSSICIATPLWYTILTSRGKNTAKA